MGCSACALKTGQAVVVNIDPQNLAKCSSCGSVQKRLHIPCIYIGMFDGRHHFVIPIDQQSECSCGITETYVFFPCEQNTRDNVPTAVLNWPTTRKE